ncbi:hypothetical protein [Burkholderia cenocepacia]|uniref:hypothetical protein n=1 Tax=Burkholderia cenocepacia TaxID=95486 RepID=UPI002AB14263|nr:hypothetical protein [Burkholderia cenocepacia]
MKVYQELIFSPPRSVEGEAYAGRGAYLPVDIRWPMSSNGQPLVHLMSLPGKWFSPNLKDDDFWISVFIPCIKDQVDHYRQLRERDGRSEAVVVGHLASESLRNESEGEISSVGLRKRPLFSGRQINVSKLGSLVSAGGEDMAF